MNEWLEQGREGNGTNTVTKHRIPYNILWHKLGENTNVALVHSKVDMSEQAISRLRLRICASVHFAKKSLV